MEIQKIFSDYNDEERYYSVLMTEEELDFIQREFGISFQGVKNAVRNVRKNGVINQFNRNQAVEPLKRVRKSISGNKVISQASKNHYREGVVKDIHKMLDENRHRPMDFFTFA